MTQFAKITLLIPTTDDWPRPDKTNWRELTDHSAEIVVLGCDYLEEDELPADPRVGILNVEHGHEDAQAELLKELAEQYLADQPQQIENL